MRISKTKEFLRKVLPVFVFQCLQYINARRLFIAKKCLFIPYYVKYIILRLLKNGDIENDEIIAIIEGGLGSQMSQFIQSQEIQRIAGVPVSYDLTWYEKDGKDLSGKENRFFILEEIFPNVQVRRASKQKIGIYRNIFNKQKTGLLMQNLDTIVIKPPMYLGGYWVSGKYSNFDMANLRKLYTFKLSLDENNRKMLDNILSKKCSVAVQIRLGDYTGTVFDVITPKYYFNAIDYIDKTIMEYKHFFIFSNDIPNAKLLIEREGIGSTDGSQSHKFTYVNINDNDHGAYDMYLMLHCHHFIIVNSTFGQWAALLSDRSKDKIVIQPDKFFKTEAKVNPFYPGWMIIEC